IDERSCHLLEFLAEQHVFLLSTCRSPTILTLIPIFQAISRSVHIHPCGFEIHAIESNRQRGTGNARTCAWRDTYHVTIGENDDR
ncbi:MAG: hypothetical protein IJ087_18220, partial [Eggerthellaceae bacterium]|nr:hypothetical protein [Eggerthellaceae bacterium]